MASNSPKLVVGARVRIITKRIPEYTGQSGRIERIATNPEGIDLLDQYFVELGGGQEIAFRASELSLQSVPE